MENILETVEKFLLYSDEKMEELKTKKQDLKIDFREERRKDA